MTNRREFIQSSLIASAALAGALPQGPAAASAYSASPALRLELFVFDRRFESAEHAARLAARRGVELADTVGDVTDLWYRDLDPSWRERPMALAGVTTRGALFVLETLAADRGMRVAYSAEHGVDRRSGEAARVFRGRAELFADFLPASLDRDEHGEILCSWIIAPRAALAVTA